MTGLELSSEVPGPECKLRVRSSIVSQHRCAHELIRDSERRSDLLLHWFCSRVVMRRCVSQGVAGRSSALLLSRAQTMRAFLAATATQAR